MSQPSPALLSEPDVGTEFPPLRFRDRLARFDGTAVTLLNGTSRIRGVTPTFALFSRLGDGVLWYGLMALLLVFGPPGSVWIVAQMLGVGAVALLVYKVSKALARRPRPYVALERITLGADPLDEYSFPSGHTMHAVAFSVVLAAHAPAATPALALVCGLIAASRVVLGLHYTTDVILGGLLGFLIAWSSFPLMSWAGLS